jgi:hypothetical protein
MFREAFWVRSWSILFKEEERIFLKKGCWWLEAMSLGVFNKNGWNVLKRLKD